MKKILSMIMALMLLVVPSTAFAKESKTFEVPVEVMHNSKVANKKSMADKAIKRSAIVTENGTEANYTVEFKPMEFMNLKGKVVNLFVLNEGNKVEAKKTENGENNKFEFKVNELKKADVEIAIWVDAMDQISGGKPGSGEQKAILKFDWSKAVEVGQKSADTTNATDKGIKILVDGKSITMDTPAYAENNRTMVPLRFISEALGLKVDWDASKNMVIIGENNSKVEIVLGKNEIKKSDGTIVKIDSPAVAKNNRTFVPLRAIAEISGAKVDWNSENQTVSVTK